MPLVDKNAKCWESEPSATTGKLGGDWGGRQNIKQNNTTRNLFKKIIFIIESILMECMWIFLMKILSSKYILIF